MVIVVIMYVWKDCLALGTGAETVAPAPRSRTQTPALARWLSGPAMLLMGQWRLLLYCWPQRLWSGYHLQQCKIIRDHQQAPILICQSDKDNHLHFSEV